MTTLTKPQGRIPIGFAFVGGVQVPITIDREWDTFLSNLAIRAGGITGVSTTELVESSFEDAGINEMQAQMYAIDGAQNQRPPVVFTTPESIDNTAELHARISVLESEIQALRQGLYP